MTNRKKAYGRGKLTRRRQLVGAALTPSHGAHGARETECVRSHTHNTKAPAEGHGAALSAAADLMWSRGPRNYIATFFLF